MQDKPQSKSFLARWVLNCAGIWLASVLLGGVSYGDQISTLIWSGLILSIVNALIKPVVTFLSIPAIIVTLGLFLAFVNGLMVYIAAYFVGNFEISSFGSAIIAGIIIWLVNVLISSNLQKSYK